MLVFTIGHGVNGFTLDPSTETFYLSHPDIKTPSNGEIFSINEGNDHLMPEGVREYTQFCHETSNGKRTHTARFMGSLVADFSQKYAQGGIYIYPTTTAAPNGRLRLLYECAPLAWIIEQAGGKASDGFGRILDIRTQDLHQEVPLFIGSSEMVEKSRTIHVRSLKSVQLKDIYLKHPCFSSITSCFQENTDAKYQIKHLVGAQQALIAAHSVKEIKRPQFFILQDKEEANYFLNDLETLTNSQILFYPSSYRRPYQLEDTDNANILLRTEVLNGNQRNKPIIVSYPEAIFEKVVSQEQLKTTL